MAVPWRKSEDDPRMDGKRLKSEVVVMDKKDGEKLEVEEHVPVPNRLCISRENCRNLDSQRGVRGACRCSAGMRDKLTRKIVEDESRRS